MAKSPGMSYITLSKSLGAPEATTPRFAASPVKELLKTPLSLEPAFHRGNHGPGVLPAGRNQRDIPKTVGSRKAEERRETGPAPKEAAGAEQPESDESLMARLAGNEQSALQALLDRYSRVITGVIFNVVRDEGEAEEVLNEVFLHSWNNASQYSPAKGKALGWLVTMARRRGIDRLRKRQRYCRATERLEVEVRNNPGAWISGRDTAREAESADVRRFIREKMENLPIMQREAIEFTFYKGMSQREIAAVTGIPLGTVKTRIELGLKKLAAALQPLGRGL